MSYYNQILKCIKIKNVDKINDDSEDEYMVYFEGCKDFEKLKSAVGISCSSSEGDVIVLKTIVECSVVIRPRDLKFPDNTFYGEAGNFILLDDIKKHLNKDLIHDDEIKNEIKEYIKHVDKSYQSIIMTC